VRGFTGVLLEEDAPFRVELFYRGRNWRPIKFELGTDEIGDSFDYDLLLSDEIKSELESYGTEYGSERAHDLVDLQLISQNEDLDLALVRKTCVRLFNFRNKHSWPPKFEENEAIGWGNRFISEVDNSLFGKKC
jgi:hypothetical protein